VLANVIGENVPSGLRREFGLPLGQGTVGSGTRRDARTPGCEGDYSGQEKRQLDGAVDVHMGALGVVQILDGN